MATTRLLSLKTIWNVVLFLRPKNSLIFREKPDRKSCAFHDDRAHHSSTFVISEANKHVGK